MRYQPPVPDHTTISSGYGPRRDPSVHQRPGGHPGLDYRLAPGSPVTAAADGVVVRVAQIKGYDLTAVIAHADGNHTLYGHLESASVAVGDEVRRGARIARSGKPGKNSTGPHLHFTVLRGVKVPEQGPLGYYVDITNTINPELLFSKGYLDQFLDAARELWDKVRDIVDGAENGAATAQPAAHGKIRGEDAHDAGPAHGDAPAATSFPAPTATPAAATALPGTLDGDIDAPDEWSLPAATPAGEPDSPAGESVQPRGGGYELSPLSQEDPAGMFQSDDGGLHADGWYIGDYDRHDDPAEAGRVHHHCDGSGAEGGGRHHHDYQNHHAGDNDSHRTSSHGGGDHSSWSHSNY